MTAATVETVLVVQETNVVDNKNKQEDSANVVIENTTGQCLCSTNIVESPDDQSKVKEPFTAPF